MVEFLYGTSFISGNLFIATIGPHQKEDNKTANQQKNSVSGLKKSIDVTKSTAKLTTTRPAPTHYATVHLNGRLGNQMFKFASMFGIAKHNNLIPVIPPHPLRDKIFKIYVGNTTPEIKYTKKYFETNSNTFEPAFMSIGESENLWIHGYLQSWKYFQHVEKELRDQYTFQDHIAQKSKSTFLAVIAANKNKITSETVYVAVHVRRGDMAKSNLLRNKGYTVADTNYLEKAMNAFRKDFKNVLFVVGSDDLNWCRENLKEADIVFIPPGSSPEMDVAILTNCNHTVVTVGTYGWWTAWLINGKTIYYKGFPRPNSRLAAMFKAEDHFLPKWIPM